MNTVLLACSGEGAPQAIARNIDVSFTQFLIAGSLLGFSALLFLAIHSGRAFPLVCLLLIAFHPVWTISAIHGDCGRLKAGAAQVVTVLTIAIVFGQAAWCLAGFARRKNLALKGLHLDSQLDE